MKILRIYSKLPPFFGGMENHIRYLTEYQKDNGIQVNIFFNQGNKLSAHDVQILGAVPLHRIRPQFIGILFFYFGIMLHLLFNRTKVDLVHIHGDWSSLLFARCIKKLTQSSKIIFSFHGSAEHYTLLKKKMLTQMAKQADRVFCTGYNSFLVLKHHPGSIFQPSGIDPVFFEKKSVEKNKIITIITVASLSKVKNLATIISIAAKFPQLVFIIAGEGPERKAIESLIKRKDLTNVSVPGHFGKQELAELLQAAHIFLMSSLEEGTSTAVLEAMACGLPLVCSDAGGLSRFLEDGKHGFFIRDPKDVDAYCRLIKELTDSRDRMKSFGLANREFAKAFSWSSVGKQITEKMLDAQN